MTSPSPHPPVKWWTGMVRRASRAPAARAGNATTPGQSAATNPRGDTDRVGGTATNFARQIGTATVTLVGFYAVACVVLGISLSSHWGRQPFTIMFAAALIALASAGLGALLGFIFAIPRELQSTELDADSKSTRYIANTNLEQISDWLTKIIVGVSLVQIGKLPAALADLGHHLAPLLGSSEASGGVGVVLCMTAAIAAFLLGYLWTRVIVTWLFAATGRDIEDYTKRTAQKIVVEATQAAAEAGVVKAVKQNITDKSMADTILESFRSEVAKSAITVDFRKFDPVLSAIQFPLSDETTVRDLLNFIYGALPDSVPAFAYGEEWLLRRLRDGKVFLDMGTRWADANSVGTDDRALAEVGILPGDVLEVIPGPGRRARQPQ
jgi:hypothetical protein